MTTINKILRFIALLIIYMLPLGIVVVLMDVIKAINKAIANRYYESD